MNVFVDEKLAESKISERFNQLDCTIDFKNLKYVGTRTERPPTNFSKFRKVLLDQLENKQTELKGNQSLNDKFSGEVDKPKYINTEIHKYINTEIHKYIESCTRSMNHDVEVEPHENSCHCKYQHQYGNKVFLCKVGEVLECKSCGVIYRSREKWYGNKEVEEVVRTDIRHVWQDGYHSLDASHNAARKVIDGFHYIADSISNVGAKPTQMISDWMTDRIAPDYWIPNSEISQCEICNIPLENEQKHHCRACGKGFCDSCSSKKRPVPERGWGDQLVRIYICMQWKALLPVR
ncbi:hypothetical protein KUTeg_017407 [Tegillarca granosa]|uniref:FYVE-type domain-containing protein n=1 Tax=Tegillarca granosa TaxID=220873 RepID=A0ABQ9EJR4_TEGGR|nr:hypothetical protein KUTeg_017407 [Tegillarca granosa]